MIQWGALFALLAAALAVYGAKADQLPNVAINKQFGPPQVVTISGYSGQAMEPFLSRDGKLLYFNNRNGPTDQTDLHVARAVSPTQFAYIGPLAGANSAELDGVASADRSGRFYFVSTRDYAKTGNTLWSGQLHGGEIADAAPLATDFTPRRPLRLNIDLEISADGSTLYFAENRWDLLRGAPATSDLAMAARIGERFVRLPDSNRLMARVNTSALEFAPATSADQLTLYFTRLDMGRLRRKQAGAFQVMVATRPNRRSPWSIPQRIGAIDGHVEAPTVTPDGCALYFHKLDPVGFRIYLTRRKDCQPST